MPAATNRLGLSFMKETTFGTVPSGTLTDVRFTSESLKQDTSTTTSAEIRSDRQVPGVPRTSVGASGDIAFELYTKGSLETLFAAAMQAAESAVAEDSQSSLTVTVVASTGVFSVSTGTPFSAFAVGEWVKTVGFADAGNNSWFRISAATSTQFTVANKDGLVDVSADSGVTATTGAYYTNGTSQRSYSFEKEWTDVSLFEQMSGATLEGISLTVPTDGIITGSFSAKGKQCISAASSIDSGAHTGGGTGAVLSGVDDVQACIVNGETITITGFNFTTVNNLRERKEVGSAFSTSIGAGSLGVTGSFQVYFAAGDPVTIYDLYTAGTTSDVAIIFTDGTNQIAIDFPRVRFTSGQRIAGGQNQDVIMEIGFEAYMHETLSHTMRYTKW